MLEMLERALPPLAQRPGLLAPDDVLDLLACRRGLRLSARELSEFFSRPLDQVLHVLSYLTSLGLLITCRDGDVWTYRLPI